MNDDKIKQLLDENARLKNIIAVMPGHIYWKNREGVLLGCNDNMLEYFGLKSEDDISGITDFEFQPKQIAKIITQIDQEIMESGKEKLIEEPDSFDPEKMFLTHKVPLKDKNNKVIGLVGISLDITERKKLAEQLKISQQEKLQEMKILAASIAHELRTPLASIQLSSSGICNFLPKILKGYLMAKEANLPVDFIRPSTFEALLELGELIKHEAVSGNHIISMLLMNIKDELQNKENFKQISIVECVNKSLNRYPFNSNEQRNIVEWNPQQRDFHFIGDLTLSIHVLFNLLKNSLYYISNKPDAKITISLEHDNKYNILNFRDNGPGIPMSILPHIFDRFYSKRTSGTGVGLAFCQLIMKSYGGSIECKSKENDYTLFKIFFPKLKKILYCND